MGILTHSNSLFQELVKKMSQQFFVIMKSLSGISHGLKFSSTAINVRAIIFSIKLYYKGVYCN